MVGEKNGTDKQTLRDNLLSQTDQLYVKRTCVIWECFPLENGKKKNGKISHFVSADLHSGDKKIQRLT